jgi:hypothetical protein
MDLAPTCFGAAVAPSSGNSKDPDEIVRMLRHKCRIRNDNHPNTTRYSHSVPSADNTQMVSTLCLHSASNRNEY